MRIWPLLATWAVLGTLPANAQTPSYPWLNGQAPSIAIASEIPPPDGYARLSVDPGSFAEWLRGLPLKERGTPVRLYSGAEKGRQDVHHAVVDIDVGKRDLQQCADAVIRLRAEYLFSQGRFKDVCFNFTSGDNASFERWALGERPVVNGARVTWAKKASQDSSYANFKKYLETLFMYAGSYSLSKEMTLRDIGSMQIGDVFIQGGFPGHAVIVVDVAENPQTGEKIFLLAQSYMPAQDIHVLRNPNDAKISPWYRIPTGAILTTPEWVFKTGDLRSFQNDARRRME